MQRRTLFFKTEIVINCLNCKHCVDDSDIYICEVSNKQIGDFDTDLYKILDCKDGEDWEIDKSIANEDITTNTSRFELIDKIPVEV